MKKVDITNKKFNFLTAIKHDCYKLMGKRDREFWICKCICNKEISILKENITNGHTKSCGCNGRINEKGEYRCSTCKKYFVITEMSKDTYRCRFCISIKNKEHELRTNFRKNKVRTNLQYRIKSNLRSRLTIAIKRSSSKKSLRTLNLLGCSIDFLKQYLKEKFTENMSWDNYGKWHIDHIKPCVLFDLTIEEEQRKCFHYTNLQPLWAKDNLQKNSKYE